MRILLSAFLRDGDLQVRIVHVTHHSRTASKIQFRSQSLISMCQWVFFGKADLLQEWGQLELAAQTQYSSQQRILNHHPDSCFQYSLHPQRPRPSPAAGASGRCHVGGRPSSELWGRFSSCGLLPVARTQTGTATKSKHEFMTCLVSTHVAEGLLHVFQEAVNMSDRQLKGIHVYPTVRDKQADRLSTV